MELRAQLIIDKETLKTIVDAHIRQSGYMVLGQTVNEDESITCDVRPMTRPELEEQGLPVETPEERIEEMLRRQTARLDDSLDGFVTYLDNLLERVNAPTENMGPSIIAPMLRVKASNDLQEKTVEGRENTLVAPKATRREWQESIDMAAARRERVREELAAEKNEAPAGVMNIIEMEDPLYD